MVNMFYIREMILPVTAAFNLNDVHLLPLLPFTFSETPFQGLLIYMPSSFDFSSTSNSFCEY